jgi:hypothetical protein
MTKDGRLRVWHIPQIPGKPFEVEVADLEQALFTLKTLAQYDIFQFENRIKGDYSNANGLEVFRNGEWEEWENEDGDDIDYVRRFEMEQTSV